jgi:biopolymer transport protein TolQ
VTCWAIIFAKLTQIRTTTKQDRSFLDLFWQGKNLDEVFDRIDRFPRSPIATVFSAGYKELSRIRSGDSAYGGVPGLGIENVQRALTRTAAEQVALLEKYVSWLATTASAAPFVGLFGTVWGIMDSFHKIGLTGSASLAVVAPGISEALIATAVGLAAAIPAVVAYNHFVAKIRHASVEIETFSHDLLNIVQQGLVRSARIDPPGRLARTEPAPR